MEEPHKYIPDDPKYWPVENINYSFPLDFIYKAISSRICFLQDSLLSLNTLLQQRNEMQDKFRSEFDDRRCQIQSLLFEMESLNLPPQAKSSLEAQMNSILREKHGGEVSNWRDTFTVRIELLRTEKELRTAIQDLGIIRILWSSMNWNLCAIDKPH